MKCKKYLLGDVCNFIDYRGKTPPKTTLGIPLVTAKIIKNGVIQEPQEFIDESFYEEWMRRGIPKKGDVIFTTEAPLGEVAKIRTDEKLAFAQRVIILEPNEEVLDSDYLFYAMQDRVLKGRIEARSSGTTAIGIKAKELKQVEIDLPSIEIQKKIGKVLSAMDDKIAVNNDINKNLEEQAKAIFDRMISSSNSPYCTLSEIAELNPKRTISKGTVARCIDMAQLSTSTSFPNGWEYKPFNGGMRFCNGDTLLARITPCLENGKTAYINFLDDDEVAFGSTEYVVIRSKTSYPAEFFYCLARYPAFVDYAVKNMNGSSGRQRVSAETVGKYELPRLTDSELSEFASVVPQMFDVCCNNALENIRLANLRDTLLPRLMSGEIDVSGIEI